jgi:hypothetical protein
MALKLGIGPIILPGNTWTLMRWPVLIQGTKASGVHHVAVSSKIVAAAAWGDTVPQALWRALDVFLRTRWGFGMDDLWPVWAVMLLGVAMSMSYLLAMLNEPSSVWLWRMLGVIP